MPTISKKLQAILSARQVETVEAMQELASYYPPLAIPQLPPLGGPPATRAPRFAPARHKTPAPPDLLGAWRDNLTTLASTPRERGAAQGVAYRPVLLHGHAYYTPTGRLLCRLPHACPPALRKVLLDACITWAQSQQITL